MLGKAGLFLIQIDRGDTEIDRCFFLQLQKYVQQRVAVLAAGQADHHLVTVFDHAEIGNRPTHLMAQALGQFIGLIFVRHRRAARGTRRDVGEGQIHGVHLCILPATRGLPSRYAESMSQPLNPAEQSRLSQRMAVLRQEHRDLDAAIEQLQADIRADELMLKRFKKRKLLLKDQIAWIENALIPDQPA